MSMHNIKLTKYHSWDGAENKSKFGAFSDLMPLILHYLLGCGFQVNDVYVVSIKANNRDAVSPNGHEEHS